MKVNEQDLFRAMYLAGGWIDTNTGEIYFRTFPDKADEQGICYRKCSDGKVSILPSQVFSNENYVEIPKRTDGWVAARFVNKWEQRLGSLIDEYCIREYMNDTYPFWEKDITDNTLRQRAFWFSRNVARMVDDNEELKSLYAELVVEVSNIFRNWAKENGFELI